MRCAYTNSQEVGQQFTSFTYTAGLEASRSFTLRIIAKDAAGNYSKYSNSVTYDSPRRHAPDEAGRLGDRRGADARLARVVVDG